ncbi:MAG: hypothetical protein J0H47_08265 [Gammaproteobacteria bacterium]|nr:hypothetical protein [Gammaproteobacteria bacterium]
MKLQEFVFLPKIIFLSTCIGLYSLKVNAQMLCDDEIRAIIIENSLNAYTGLCPCPYSIHWDGQKCGRRSAYIHPKNYHQIPICYPDYISDEMVQSFRDLHHLS